MKNLSIKIKLILIFVLIKVLPLILIMYLSIEGIYKINNYFLKNTETIYEVTQDTIKSTAGESIKDSIKALNDKSQKAIEKYTNLIASDVASFLYERDKDILFLSTQEPNIETYKNFISLKTKAIKTIPEYIYDSKKDKWVRENKKEKTLIYRNSELKDNQNEFRTIIPSIKKVSLIPLYKEISFFNLDGLEEIKVSTLDSKKKDISIKSNTFLKAEDYFNQIKGLKKGEIYVSNVIGEYVKSNVIGEFTKQKANKLGIDFNPKEQAYAGVENPVGKKFEGIIRFVSAVYKDEKKIGYVSFALDHIHVMEFTDTFNPSESFEEFDISNASLGNYAFMWDNKGRNISHPRDYFIVGFNKQTGKYETPWLSQDLYEKFKKSNRNIDEFLEVYPKFENQSLSKKPNLKQLKENGNIALDCRYLNFAPQCKGWMDITKNGGYGSFLIYWSNIWKLTTASTIPYYTGQYGESKRGFGFVTMGANVDEFHLAANKTKESVDSIVKNQIVNINDILKTHQVTIDKSIYQIIEELTFSTILMIVIVILIAVWLANIISNKIKKLITGTSEFSKKNFEFRIENNSNDEIGELEKSFNNMAQTLKENNLQMIEQNRIMCHQSKTAAMGEMMDAIAHQWKQPLSVITVLTSNLDLQNDLNPNGLPNDLLKESIENIDMQVKHLTETTDEFRKFFRTDINKEEIDLSKFLHDVIEFDKHIFIENKIVSEVHSSEKILCRIVSNEFKHVILNLIGNSKDAFIDNKIENRKIIFELSKENTYIKLLVKDNAGGIPDGIIEKIFDVNFTTKEKGKGTGIGLYMTKLIIDKINASIEVSNIDYFENGILQRGAQFMIKIPSIS